MRRKLVLRGLMGLPLGLALGYVITIVSSLLSMDGRYAPCAPELTAAMGSELAAVGFQALLCALLGFGFGAGSVIWELEDWGLVKQTGVYFALISLVMLPIAYVSYWMEHSPGGVLVYFGIFLGIFAVVWAAQYAAARRNVRKLNELLRSRHSAKE